MTAPNRFKPHVTVATLVEKDDKLLMVEEWQNQRLCLNQPAGHLEANETLIAAAQRETLEETAWRVSIRQLSGIYQYQHDNKPYLRFCFVADALEQVTDYELDQGIERAVWLSYDEIQAQHSAGRLRSDMVMECVNYYRNGKTYPLDILTCYE